MPTVVQNAKMTITAGFGSAGEDLTLGVATQGGQTFYAGGVRDGNTILYVIFTGSDMESGQAIYHQSGPSLIGRSPSISTNNNGPITVSSSSYVMATAIVDSSNNPFAGSVMVSNLEFDPTVHSLRIRGDLSNSNPAYRLSFQTALENSKSVLTILPSGSSMESAFRAESTAGASGTAAKFGVSGDEVMIINVTHGGVASPINVYRDTTLLVSLDDAAGNARFYNYLKSTTPAFGDTSDTVATTQYVQSAIGGVVGLQSAVSSLQASVSSLLSTRAFNGANSDITSLAGLTGAVTTSGANGLIQSVDDASTTFPWNVGTSEGPIYQYVSRASAGIYKSDDTGSYNTAWSFNFDTGAFHTDAALLTCGSIQTSSGVGVGGVSVGLWGDTNNLALRAPASSGAVLFQDPSGSHTWGWFHNNEVIVYSDGIAYLTLWSNNAANDLYYIKQIISDTAANWIFRQIRPLDSSSIDTYIDQSGGTILTTMNASATMSSLFAPLNSPPFTGSPTAPTPSAGSSNTHIATTAYVAGELAPYLTASSATATYMPIAGGTFTGAISLSADPASALQPATKQYVDAATTLSVGDIAGAAPLASPLFTGIVGVIGTTNAALRGFVSYQYSSDENSARFVGAKARGTYAVPSPLLSGDGIAMLSAVGWGPLDEEWSSSVGYLEFIAAENWSDIANGSFARIGLTPVGSVIPQDVVFVRPNSLAVQSNLSSTPLRGLQSYQYSSDSAAGRVMTFKARGSISSPSAVLATDALGLFGSFGYGSTGWSSNVRAYIGFFAAENWTDTSQGTYAIISTTPVGGTTLTERMRVDQAGLVGINCVPSYRLDVAGDVHSSGYFRGDGSLLTGIAASQISGLLTSVGLSSPDIFSVSGSPVTSSGTLTFSLVNQSANTIFSGPSSGAAAAPSFRALVSADIPTLSTSKISGLAASATTDTTNATNISSGTLSLARLASVAANIILAGATSGGSTTPAFRALVAADIPALSYVTSVALSVPGVIFSVSGSPITSSGTLTFSLLNQNANTIFAGPSTGAAAAPSFRSLTSADIPSSVALSGSPTAPTPATSDNSTSIATTAWVTSQAVNYGGTTTITILGTVATGTWQATKISEVYGGTNQSSYVLGDTLYSSASNTLAKLAGNATSTKKYLSQTGTGTVSAAPVWAQVAAADISGLATSATTDATNASNISSGTLSLARLATVAANLVLAGATSGGSTTPAFRSLVSADIPTTLGDMTFSSVTVSSTSPYFVFYNSSGGTNGKYWENSVSGSVMQFFTADDGLVAGNNWMAVTRSGTAISSVNFPGLSVNNNGISVGSGYNSTTAPADGAIIQGNVGIGTTAPAGSLDAVATTAAASRGVVSSQFTNDTASAVFIGRKARGTLASPTTVITGDYISGFIASGYDGANYQQGGFAGFQANGTIAAGSVPTDFVVYTGSSALGSQRMVITSAGNFGLGTTSPTEKATISLNATASLSAGLAGTVLRVANADGTGTRVLLDCYGSIPTLNFRRANNTAASPSALASGDVIAVFGGYGYGATGYASGNRAAIQFTAAEAWTDAATGTNIIFVTTKKTTAGSAQVGKFDDVGAFYACLNSATPAGGTAGLGLRLGTSPIDVLYGSGAPTCSAAKGSLYLRSDGTTTNNRAYINTDGGTTWTALTTAA